MKRSLPLTFTSRTSPKGPISSRAWSIRRTCAEVRNCRECSSCRGTSSGAGATTSRDLTDDSGLDKIVSLLTPRARRNLQQQSPSGFSHLCQGRQTEDHLSWVCSASTRPRPPRRGANAFPQYYCTTQRFATWLKSGRISPKFGSLHPKPSPSNREDSSSPATQLAGQRQQVGGVGYLPPGARAGKGLRPRETRARASPSVARSMGTWPSLVSARIWERISWSRTPARANRTAVCSRSATCPNPRLTCTIYSRKGGCR